ncbi:hypothetical protein T10_11890 [Trichinella papuae]|uniref:Transmembrane protein n=1 Tax=Trichinella papuae TaxID=268474 RepID=A0A0V1N2I0_9BILA|nr:hypothetical protein T10_11890 [Trichinella papuae]
MLRNVTLVGHSSLLLTTTTTTTTTATSWVYNMGEKIEIDRKKARKFPWLRSSSWKEAVRLFLVAVPLTAAIFFSLIFSHSVQLFDSLSIFVLLFTV